MSHCWMIAATSPSPLKATRATRSSIDSAHLVTTSRTAIPSAAIAALTVADGELAGVEDGRREHRVGAGGDGGGEVLGPPGASGGDDRHAGDLAHEADELEVEALAGAVGVDRVDQQLPGAALDRLARPLQCVEARLGAAAVGRDDESGGVGRAKRA